MDTPMPDTAMPTPPASSHAPSTIHTPLPQPRRHPLKPGGPKESDLIRYLDHGLNAVQRKVDNRLQQSTSTSTRTSLNTNIESERYTTFTQIEKDLEGLLDVIWVSGSPNLQIPYLLRVGGMLTDILPLFPCAPKATFRILDKFDTAFFSLLTGRDAETSEPLPGFESGRTISTTDKVRLKGIVDRTRLIVVRRMGGGGAAGDEETETETEDESTAETDGEGYVKFEGFDDDDDDEEEEERWEEMETGKVYERTIGELGDELRGPPIGIITDD